MITIVGAGLAGLLAASMLSRRDEIVVIEEQGFLPNNHSALLRFRSPLVGEVTGIPFRKVKVVKSWAQWRNPVADALAYSMKNLGEYRTDRSIRLETEIVDRWIAPDDFIPRLYAMLVANGVKFIFDMRYGFGTPSPGFGHVISTIPMPSLMKALDYPLPHPPFRYISGANVHAKIIGSDAYVSLAVPSPDLIFSRASITGEDLIVEVPHKHGLDTGEAETIASSAAALLGLSQTRIKDVRWSAQRYAKIVPIDEEARRTFIFWASTIQRRSFSLGRFATWRPGLLLDDAVNDVRVIEKLIDSPHLGYTAQKMEIEK